MRTAILVVVVAAALLPTVAHAEFATPKETLEVRAPSVKRAKPLPVRTAMTPRLSVEDVLTKINNIYMTGLRRCYEKALAIDPSISGKVSLTFTINAMGHVSPDVDGSANGVNACVTSLASRWRFEAPRDDNGLPSEETFRISLVLATN